MIGPAVAAMLALVVGAGSLLLSTWADRQAAICRQVEKALLRMLSVREPRTLDSLFDDCGIAPALRDRARVLLSLFRIVSPIEPARLRSTDSLRDLCEWRLDQLPAVSPEEWTRSGFRETVDPYSDSLLDEISMSCGREEWETIWRSVEMPLDSQRYLDFMLDMTICEWLHFFTPAIKSPSKSPWRLHIPNGLGLPFPRWF